MYDWPEVHWAHDALWVAVAARLRDRGVAAPAALDRTRASDEVWADPGLVLSQTCGYPFSTRLIGKVHLVATPVYAAEGCRGPYYSTFIIAPKGKRAGGLAAFAGRRFAFNASDSLSGYVALRVAMRESGIDPEAAAWIETGSHRASVGAVAEGEADIASIDAICWALAKDHEAEAVSRLQVVERTPLRPGLPFLTANRGEAEIAAIRGAIEDAITDPATETARRALHLSGVALLAEPEYAALAGLA
jgi:ABC-type phosphate/phosphonate transport system substrate-binding protein